MACLHYTSALATAAAGHTCRCSSTTTVAHLHHPQVARCRAHHCSAPRLLWPCQPSRHGVMTTAAGSGGAAGSSNNSESSGQLGFIQRWQRDSKQMQAQLQALGAAGVIAYGEWAAAEAAAVTTQAASLRQQNHQCLPLISVQVCSTLYTTLWHSCLCGSALPTYHQVCVMFDRNP